MEVVLYIALILSNMGWLVYLHFRDERDRKERRQYENRIAKPGTVIEELPKHVKSFADETNEDSGVAEREAIEFAAIGQVNPELSREDNGR